jgi:hypothetical protein
MSFKHNVNELKEFLNYKRKESTLRARMIKKNLKKENREAEYYNFKKVVFQQIDEMLYSGEYSKLVLKPLKDKEYNFELLVKDEDFIRYYDGRLTAGGELEVGIKRID